MSEPVKLRYLHYDVVNEEIIEPVRFTDFYLGGGESEFIFHGDILVDGDIQADNGVFDEIFVNGINGNDEDLIMIRDDVEVEDGVEVYLDTIQLGQMEARDDEAEVLFDTNILMAPDTTFDAENATIDTLAVQTIGNQDEIETALVGDFDVTDTLFIGFPEVDMDYDEFTFEVAPVDQELNPWKDATTLPAYKLRLSKIIFNGYEVMKGFLIMEAASFDLGLFTHEPTQVLLGSHALWSTTPGVGFTDDFGPISGLEELGYISHYNTTSDGDRPKTVRVRMQRLTVDSYILIFHTENSNENLDGEPNHFEVGEKAVAPAIMAFEYVHAIL